MLLRVTAIFVDFEGGLELGVVDIENVQDHRFQSIRR